jgi:predicted MFS family arabinose efflux permease
LVGIMFSFVPMTNVVVGRRLPDENRVSIFSILQSGVFLGLSVGALLGGILSDALSPESAAGGALAVGALGLFLAIPLLTTRL